MDKYVQSGAPWLYAEHLRERILRAYTGHLHFPGYYEVDRMQCHMLGMGVQPSHRPEALEASAVVLDYGAGEGQIFSTIIR